VYARAVCLRIGCPTTMDGMSSSFDPREILTERPRYEFPESNAWYRNTCWESSGHPCNDGSVGESPGTKYITILPRSVNTGCRDKRMLYILLLLELLLTRLF